DPRNGKGWMRDPFQNDDGRDQLPSQQDDQLIELMNDGGLKTFYIIDILLDQSVGRIHGDRHACSEDAAPVPNVISVRGRFFCHDSH
ncbi:hypothetical protein NHX12_001855, partial [Muraenolepis orangiensis]